MKGASTSWSRRQAAVAAESAALERAAQDADVQKQHAAFEELSDEEILQELGLPDPDTLVQGDDFKAFLAKAVPEHLRKRALRNLWRSNPVLACVDGLNDYDDDYLTGSTGQGVLKTTYKVGKGMLAHLVEMERQQKALQAPSEIAEPEEVEALTVTAVEEPIAAEPEAAEPAPVDVPEDEIAVVAPRRMQFQFEESSA